MCLVFELTQRLTGWRLTEGWPRPPPWPFAEQFSDWLLPPAPPRPEPQNKKKKQIHVLKNYDQIY